MKQLVAVTGGSGHVGYCLVNMLLREGYQVRAQYHSHLPNLQHPKLEWIRAHILDISELSDFMDGCRIVVHTAGKISVKDSFEKDVWDINVKGIENVIESCILKKVKRLIHLSSSHANVKDRFTYAHSKGAGEKLVIESAKRKFLEALVIRPTSIVGPPDIRPSLMGQAIFDMADNTLPAVTTGGYDLIDVRDLCQTIINCFEKGKSGEIYNAGGKYISMGELFEIVNPQKKPLTISIDLLLFILPLIKAYNYFFPMPWPISKQSLLTLKYADTNFDDSEARATLGHQIRPLHETIHDLLEWRKYG